jgi:AcrR family transcriptional regulator
MSTANPVESETRVRLLEATKAALGRTGMRKLTLTDVATTAGVSRPTLYRYFPTKSDLLAALAVHEQQRFDDGVAAAVKGRTGVDRLDAAMRFVVAFQQDYPIQLLVDTEPEFVLAQVAAALPAMRATLIPLFKDLKASGAIDAVASPFEIADLVVRTALSHFLIPGKGPAQELRELRHAAGLR